MYFRDVSDCCLSKFSGLNVENNNRKHPGKTLKTLTKNHAVSPKNEFCKKSKQFLKWNNNKKCAKAYGLKAAAVAHSSMVL